MSSRFNLLSLNIKELDKHPRSWICISGKNIKNIISEIEREIIKKHCTDRENLSKLISRNISCNFVSIKKILRGAGKFYPIPIILELCKLSQDERDYIKRLEEEIECLKVNSASAKPVKASKCLSPNLAKIIGAFCADGSLSMQFVISNKNKEDFEKLDISKGYNVGESPSRKEYYIAIQINKDNYAKVIQFFKENKEFQTQTHYTIELTDEHKSSVEAFNRWIFDEFKIKPTAFYNRENAWRTIFSNKILARYLINFFNFMPSYKATTVDEPELIKRACFEMRKEFAKGVLMFDGSVLKRKIISLTTMSEKLAISIKEILEKDGLKVGFIRNKRGEYVVYTFAKQDMPKLLEYFEEKTKKWELLMWLSKKDFESEQITYEKDLANTKSILEILKEMSVADTDTLKNKSGWGFNTIRHHLFILKAKGLIKLSNHPKRLNKFVSENTTILLKKRFHEYLFNKILNKFKNYEEFASFLGLNKATLSAWKVRKNRIPLKAIREICASLEIPFNSVLENIYETNKEIAELI